MNEDHATEIYTVVLIICYLAYQKLSWNYVHILQYCTKPDIKKWNLIWMVYAEDVNEPNISVVRPIQKKNGKDL